MTSATFYLKMMLHHPHISVYTLAKFYKRVKFHGIGVSSSEGREKKKTILVFPLRISYLVMPVDARGQSLTDYNVGGINYFIIHEKIKNKSESLFCTGTQTGALAIVPADFVPRHFVLIQYVRL
jgi:hypothetical protein